MGKPIKIKAKAENLCGWSFSVVDAETGQLLPVSSSDPVIITYNGPDQPIKATLTLLLSEIDISEAVMLEQST